MILSLWMGLILSLRSFIFSLVLLLIFLLLHCMEKVIVLGPLRKKPCGSLARSLAREPCVEALCNSFFPRNFPFPSISAPHLPIETSLAAPLEEMREVRRWGRGGGERYFVIWPLRMGLAHGLAGSRGTFCYACARPCASLARSLLDNYFLHTI